MPDQLQSIVQRMIDAGEPEENIGTVIQHFKAQAPQPIAANEPDTYLGGVAKGYVDYAKEHGLENLGKMAGGFLRSIDPRQLYSAAKQKAQQDAEGFRSPQTPSEALKFQSPPDPYAGMSGQDILDTAPEMGGGAIAGLVGGKIMSGLGKPLPSERPPTPIRSALRTAGAEIRQAPGSGMTGKIVGRVLQAIPEPKTFNDLPLVQQMNSLPETPAPETARMGSPVQSQPTPTPLAVQMQQPGYFPETPAPEIARTQTPPTSVNLPAEFQPTTVQGTTQLGAPAQPLSAAELRYIRQNYSPDVVAKIQAQFNGGAESPLTGPRIRTGAERVGRAEGLTKEAVRQQTGPILDEQPGEASPILPQDALNSMVDKLKAMPPEERPAYVKAANSGKTMAQVENIRRVLERLGLLVPAAVGGAALGQSALLNQMQGQPQ